MSEERYIDKIKTWLDEALEVITKLLRIIFALVGLVVLLIFGWKVIGYALSIEMRQLVSSVYALLPNFASDSSNTENMIAMLGIMLTLFLGAAVFLSVMGYRNIKSQLEVDFLNKDVNEHLKKEHFDKLVKEEDFDELKQTVTSFIVSQSEEKFKSREKEIKQVEQDKGKDANVKTVLPKEKKVNENFSNKNNKKKGGKE